jgi:hypothetical protein
MGSALYGPSALGYLHHILTCPSSERSHLSRAKSVCLRNRLSALWGDLHLGVSGICSVRTPAAPGIYSESALWGACGPGNLLWICSVRAAARYSSRLSGVPPLWDCLNQEPSTNPPYGRTYQSAYLKERVKGINLDRAARTHATHTLQIKIFFISFTSHTAHTRTPNWNGAPPFAFFCFWFF